MSEEKQSKINGQKMQEFRDRMQNYQSWRWNLVSLYQSIFIVFTTSAILILVDFISEGDIVIKLIILIFLVIFSIFFINKAFRQTQKPIFVCENAIGTIEGEPVTVKDKDGKEYSIFKISGAHHGVNRV